MNLQTHYKQLIFNLNQFYKNNHQSELNPLQFRINEFKEQINQENPIISAVTIVLFNQDDVTFSILIKRSTYEGKHSGQIALPGGKFETNDINTKNTAIRELYEELGIVISEDQIIGKLSSIYIPISNFKVFPYVAFIDKPSITINKYEVENCIIYPISDLINPESLSETQIVYEKKKYTVPAFKIKNHEVWGATSMILNDFKYRILDSIKH